MPRCGPFFALFALAPGAGAALACFGVLYFLNNVYPSAMWTLVQALVHPRLRATSASTQFAVTNRFDYGLGSISIGLLNVAFDARFGDEAIRYSLLLAAVVGALSGPCLVAISRDIRRDLPRSRRRGQPDEPAAPVGSGPTLPAGHVAAHLPPCRRHGPGFP